MKALLATAGTALALDGVWLTLRNSYHQSLFKSIQHSAIQAKIIPAILIYILIPVAIYVGAVEPSTSVHDGMKRGALIGFFLYAFYDLTNYATFTNWTLQMTLTDILWGTFLCTIAAGVGAYVKK
jgi:uncharacterized membrane protein